VTVVAATRSPGADQYSREVSPGLIRIVNNIATRALADGESDPNIDRAIQDIESEIKPDVIHAHHIQFLSSTTRFNAPTVVTLHDEWAWCAAGGLGLRDGHEVCPGPEPQSCSQCHAKWRPRPSSSARLLTKSASLVARWVPPHQLHRLYKQIPASWRPNPVHRGEHPESARAAEHRNKTVMKWFSKADVRIAPSEHLQLKAEAMGLPPVRVIRHGLSAEWFQPTASTAPRFGLVSIGTIAFHKGTDRVVSAWRSVCNGREEPLHLYGPVLDQEAALGHPIGPVLSSEDVRRTLWRSQALVIGSRWPENAPLIILEARAAQCPIVAPNLGGISELIEHGVDGFLFDSHQPDGLENALHQLFSSKPLRPRPPPQFSEAVMQIEAIYRQLTGSTSCE
jgi:glycosyltransferase involved in cell wall biosynthesis